MAKEKQFEVRDKRAKDRFYLDDIYLNGYAKKCGIYSTGVYLSLCRHAGIDQQCWPSIKKIAEELAISQTQTRRAIKILEEFKIISKERLGKKLNNRYWLLNKSEWSDRTISDEPHRTLTTSPQDTHPLPDRTLHSKDTHIKETHSKELVGIPTNGEAVYGNPEINELIETLKKEFELGILDGSQKENRQYAKLMINKCGGLEVAKKVISVAAQDDFYSDKIASVKKLYYKMAEIVQKAKKKKDNVLIIR